jgi:hypothetical protein
MKPKFQIEVKVDIVVNLAAIARAIVVLMLLKS